MSEWSKVVTYQIKEIFCVCSVTSNQEDDDHDRLICNIFIFAKRSTKVRDLSKNMKFKSKYFQILNLPSDPKRLLIKPSRRCQDTMIKFIRESTSTEYLRMVCNKFAIF